MRCEECKYYSKSEHQCTHKSISYAVIRYVGNCDNCKGFKELKAGVKIGRN
jgi:hypothetical protein